MKLKSIFIVALFVVGGAVFAQGGGAKPPTGGPGGGRPGQGGPGGPGGPGGGQFRQRTPEERVERLSKTLNLNADQKKKILVIYKASGAKGKTLFEDKKLTQDQKRAAFEKMRDENAKKIKAVLTKDQVKKFDEMRAQMRRGGPGGPGGPGRAGGPGGPPKAGGTGKGGKAGG